MKKFKKLKKIRKDQPERQSKLFRKSAVAWTPSEKAILESMNRRWIASERYKKEQREAKGKR